MKPPHGFHALLLLAALSGCNPAARGPESPTPPDAQTAPPAATPSDVGLSREEQDRIPPGPPGTVRVAQRDGTWVVEWKGTRDDTIRGYQVYRRRDRGEWVPIFFVELRADDARNRGAYKFEDPSEGPFEFTVAAVDANGRPGPKSVEIQ